jgi:polar amino acid transport system ATP-binding protein
MISGINDLLASLARGGMTMVVVTHDLGFAREVAGRICFLEEGRIRESGSPEDLLSRPKDERLKVFLESCLGPLSGQG